MPMIWMPDEELRALQAVFHHEARVDWAAYDRAKDYLLNPRSAPPTTLDATGTNGAKATVAQPI